MRKFIYLFIALACLGNLAAQSTDDFFSDDDSHVLDEARRRAGTGRAGSGDDLFVQEEAGDDSVDVDVDVDVDVTVTVNPPEAAAPAKAPARDRGDDSIHLFDGFSLDFGTVAGDKYSPIVFSFVPGISLPFGTYSTNLSLGYIGSLTKNVKGVAISGVFDMIEGDLLGIQNAGVFCMVGGDMVGIQSSGVFNMAQGRMKGVQASGVFNLAEEVLGAQVSGVVNRAGNVKGIQAAGVINMAKKVTGLQIGLINLSEEMYGIPIGLFSWTRNGIRDLGFLMDSRGDDYAFIANGTSNFYAIAMAGMPEEDWFVRADRMVIGGGLGWRPLRGAVTLDLDIMAKRYFGPELAEAIALCDSADMAEVGYAVTDAFFSEGDAWYKYQWGALRATMGLRLFRGLEIFGGASVDVSVPGLFEVPELYRSDNSAGFTVEGQMIELYPSLYWGLRL